MGGRSTAQRRKERLHEANNKVAQLEAENKRLRNQLESARAMIERFKGLAQQVIDTPLEVND